MGRGAPAAKARLIVIDECSMVDAELGRDLLLVRRPVLVLGDPAQLPPPIQGGGFFTDAEPDAMLTEVHRQAADDPIIHLSMAVREGEVASSPGVTATARWCSKIRARSGARARRRPGAGRPVNATRRAYNARLRERRGFTQPMPQADDKLVCLRNNRRKGLFNGGLWTVKERGAPKATGTVGLRLLPDEGIGRAVKVTVRRECFTGGLEELDWQQRKRYDEFDYGYVLTVHKAQGSQWDDVVLFDESFAFSDSRERWLYTGITRAARRLSIVIVAAVIGERSEAISRHMSLRSEFASAC